MDFFLQKSFVLYCTGLFLLLQCENLLKNDTGSRLTNVILGQGYMYQYFVRQVGSFNSSDDVNIGSRLTNVVLGQGYMYIILVKQAVSLSSSDDGNIGACIQV